MSRAVFVTRQDKETIMLIIDRFDGDFAVVETSNGMVNIPRADIPQTAREGDTLIFQIDKNTTDKRKERIEKKMNKLFKD
jgi:hypothetical protein